MCSQICIYKHHNARGFIISTHSIHRHSYNRRQAHGIIISPYRVRRHTCRYKLLHPSNGIIISSHRVHIHSYKRHLSYGIIISPPNVHRHSYKRHLSHGIIISPHRVHRPSYKSHLFYGMKLSHHPMFIHLVTNGILLTGLLNSPHCFQGQGNTHQILHVYKYSQNHCSLCAHEHDAIVSKFTETKTRVSFVKNRLFSNMVKIPNCVVYFGHRLCFV